MLRLLPLLVAAATVLAGCLAPEAVPAALDAAPGTPPLPAGVFLHATNGTVNASVAAIPAALLRDIGATAFEPTLGVTPDGVLFYAAVGGSFAIGWAPKVLRSMDGGATWQDVSPALPTGTAVPPETNDPYLYVDPGTGRVFSFPMAPILVCGVLSWSDDLGETWTTNPRGCGTPPLWDHQTMVAAKPVAATTRGYPNVVHQCANQPPGSWCAASLDGGLTWLPSTPAFPGSSPHGATAGNASATTCNGLHGHLAAAPDGTVYLPKDWCGEPWVAISRDDGASWERVRVSLAATQGWSDPAVTVDAAGNVYYSFVDDVGRILLAVSRDAGATWSEPIVASPPGVTGHMPTIAAGDAGRVVLAYPGTEDLPRGYVWKDYETPAAERGDDHETNLARWNGYVAVLEDALAADPLVLTTRVNDPADPLVRGQCGPYRCPGMTDFIDVVIAPDGRPFAAFVDACVEKCATPEGTYKDPKGRLGLLATLEAGPRLVGNGTLDPLAPPAEGPARGSAAPASGGLLADAVRRLFG